LRTGADVQSHLHFYNTGPPRPRGLIVMSLQDDAGTIDPAHKRVVVIFNATKTTQTFNLADFQGVRMTLHPLQKISVDPVERASSFNSSLGGFSVPGLTVAVFWGGR
jgi:hypothetical protein